LYNNFNNNKRSFVFVIDFELRANNLLLFLHSFHSLYFLYSFHLFFFYSGLLNSFFSRCYSFFFFCYAFFLFRSPVSYFFIKKKTRRCLAKKGSDEIFKKNEKILNKGGETPKKNEKTFNER